MTASRRPRSRSTSPAGCRARNFGSSTAPTSCCSSAGGRSWPTPPRRIECMKTTASLAVLVLALAVVAAGCGSKKHAAGTTTTSTSTFKVGLSTDTDGLNDRSFNHLAYLGMQQAEKQLGVTG